MPAALTHKRTDIHNSINDRDTEPIAHDQHVAALPKTIWAADNHGSIVKQPKLHHADRAFRVRIEIKNDHVRAVEGVELPLHLFTKLRIVRMLLPGGIPMLATRIQDDDVQVRERRDDLVLPRPRQPHLDGTGKKHDRLVGRIRVRGANMGHRVKTVISLGSR